MGHGGYSAWNGAGIGALPSYQHTFANDGGTVLRGYNQHTGTRSSTTGTRKLRSFYSQCCVGMRRNLSAGSGGRYLCHDIFAQIVCQTPSSSYAFDTRRRPHLCGSIRGCQSSHWRKNHCRDFANGAYTLYHIAYMAGRTGYCTTVFYPTASGRQCSCGYNG